MKRAWMTMAAAAMAALMGAPALAQPAPTRDARPAAEQKHADKKAKLGRLLREDAGFDEATATRVERVMTQFEPQHRQIRQQKDQAQAEVERLIDADSNDQAAYRAALDRLEAAMQAEWQLMQREITAVRAELTPKEQARLVTAMHRAKKEWKGKKDGREDRPMPPGGTMPPGR